MKKIALTVLAVAFLASFSMAKDKALKAQKISGWVSNEKCGAKDANGAGADCTKKCAEKGSKLVIVSDKDHSVMNVDNQDALKGHEGHHVSVTGKVNGDSLHVDKVAMLKQPKATKQKGEHAPGL